MDAKTIDTEWSNLQNILDRYSAICRSLKSGRTITLFCRQHERSEALCMIQCNENASSAVASAVDGTSFGDLVSFFVPLVKDFRCNNRPAGVMIDPACSECSRVLDLPKA